MSIANDIDQNVGQQPSTAREPKPGQAAVTHNLLARFCAALLLSLALLAGFASLSGVIEGSAWFPALSVPVVLIHVCAGLLRGIRFLKWLALPTAVLISFAALNQHEAMQATDYAVSGLQWFGAVVSEAALQFSTQVPPVAYSKYAAFAILLLAVCISLLLEILISFKKLAAFVVIPLAFTPIIASLFKQEGAGIGYLALVVLGILGFYALIPYLYQGSGPEKHSHFLAPKQAGFLAVTASACVVSLLAASFWMPGFRQGMFPEGKRPSGDLLASNVDPLLNLGRDLRSNSGSTILSYFTTAKNAPYLRTAVIEDLASPVWEPDSSLPEETFYGNTAVDLDSTTFNANEEVARLDFDEGNGSTVLPLPNRSYLVEGIIGNWTWVSDSSVARLTKEAAERTEKISVGYSVLNISPEMAQNLSDFGGTMTIDLPEVYTQLPDDPENTLTRALAASLQEAYDSADSPRTELAKATAIQDFLRSSKFVYSERTPLREGYDGANKRVVEAFLNRRQGYCVHFASTMALMARAAGIPSRIAVGYAPGKPNGKTLKLDEEMPGSDLERGLEAGTEMTGYSVSGQQSHAWPELYLPGMGWIPFEPTPSQGQTPTYAPAPTASPTAQETAANEIPSNRATQRPSESESAPSTDSETTASTQTEDQPQWWWIIALVILLVCAALAVAPLRRRSLTKARRELITGNREESATALWFELQAIGADAGYRAHPEESVNDYTQRLAGYWPECTADLESIAAAIQESFYASRHLSSAQGGELKQALARVQNHAHQSLPTGRRILAAFFPASLRIPKLNRSEASSNFQNH